jgi:mannose-6-phosphate isomerase
MGLEPDGRPWAEWWLGTHPTGPATLADGRELSAVTGDLPYLLKVLAAAQPLSLQTHPTAEHARRAFEQGRCPDPFAKPELLHALTPFEAFCGIRPVDATVDLLADLGADVFAEMLVEHGVRTALTALYRGELDPQPIVDACTGSERPEARWVRRLDGMYPGEPSVAATLLLNLVHLEPGQAIRLGPGNLHAYLHGAGIELMGASDNVIRGGLTAKHVDVDHLLEVVDTTPLPHPVIGAGMAQELPEIGARLVRLQPGDHHRSTGHQLALDLHGSAWYLEPGSVSTVDRCVRRRRAPRTWSRRSTEPERQPMAARIAVVPATRASAAAAPSTAKAGSTMSSVIASARSSAARWSSVTTGDSDHPNAWRSFGRLMAWATTVGSPVARTATR